MSWSIESYGIIFVHGLFLAAIISCLFTCRWKVAGALLSLSLGLVAALFIYVTCQNNSYSESTTWLNTSPLTITIMLLINFIGLVVLRYAKCNFENDKNSARFLVWYLTTLLAVGVTVSSNNLIVFVLAWTAISLSLHQLLLFYPDRPRAALAAHKKFLFARLSELMLISAFSLIYYQQKNLTISEVIQHYQALHGTGSVSVLDQVAAVLLALVAIVKCAQLPLHGWLVQVVESPTPVSALLHAGIINLGGYLLLLFAPLLSAAVFAQWMILIMAGLSCVTAALVMMTRISIKVRLAWSTVAQMGLMLVECALGLYELALIHLIAHSCYKAHAFLNSGDVVNRYIRKQYVGVGSPRLWHWLLALVCVAVVAVVAIVVTGSLPATFSPWVVVIIASISLLAFSFNASGKRLAPLPPVIAVGSVVLYTVLGRAMSGLLPGLPRFESLLADIWISTLFIFLFLASFYISKPIASKEHRKWFVALNAGFYLDEWTTRITVQMWPYVAPKGKFKSPGKQADGTIKTPNRGLKNECSSW